MEACNQYTEIWLMMVKIIQDYVTLTLFICIINPNEHRLTTLTVNRTGLKWLEIFQFYILHLLPYCHVVG